MCRLRWYPSWRRTRKCSTATIRQGDQSDSERLGQASPAEIPEQRNRRFFFVGKTQRKEPRDRTAWPRPRSRVWKDHQIQRGLSQAPRQKVERASLPEGFTSVFE